MPKNAAHALAALFMHWIGPNRETPQLQRGFSDDHDLEAWRRHSHANDLLKSVDYTLQGLDAAGRNVDMFMSALPRWYAGLHFATTPWGQAIGNDERRHPVSEGDRNLLSALGLLLEQGDMVRPSEDTRRHLLDVLDQAKALLGEDSEEIPEDMRRYLWGLICKARQVVNNLLDFGVDVTRATAFELGGALIAQAEAAVAQGKPERASSWRTMAYWFMAPFVGAVGSETAKALGEAGLKQLGAGD